MRLNRTGMSSSSLSHLLILLLQQDVPVLIRTYSFLGKLCQFERLVPSSSAKPSLPPHPSHRHRQLPPPPHISTERQLSNCHQTFPEQPGREGSGAAAVEDMKCLLTEHRPRALRQRHCGPAASGDEDWRNLTALNHFFFLFYPRLLISEHRTSLPPPPHVVTSISSIDFQRELLLGRLWFFWLKPFLRSRTEFFFFFPALPPLSFNASRRRVLTEWRRSDSLKCPRAEICGAPSQLTAPPRDC